MCERFEFCEYLIPVETSSKSRIGRISGPLGIMEVELETESLVCNSAKKRVRR